MSDTHKEVIKNQCIKEHKVILALTPQWARELFKFESWEKGDTIFLSAIVAMATGDKQMLLNLVDLLRQRRRWPRELDHYNDAPSMFIQYLDQLLTWYNRRASRTNWVPIIPWKKRYRCVKGMTRDPFTMVIVAWEVLEMEGPCPVKVPFLIQRPAFLFWVRYMKTKRKWLRDVYEFFAILGDSPNKPMYAKHLNCWRAWVAKSTAMQYTLSSHIPDWNHLLRLLVNHPINYLCMDRMQGYKAKNGYAWTDEKYMAPPKDSRFYLDEEDTIKPDKQILDFIMNYTENES